MNSNINNVIYESLIPAFFLSVFELLFFLKVVRKDIDRGIFYMTRNITDEIEKLYDEMLKEYNIPDDQMKALMYQSFILLSKFQKNEEETMKKNNDYRVQLAYSVSIILGIMIILAAFQVKNEMGEFAISNVFSFYLLINTVIVIAAVGIFQFMFYTHFIMKYVKSDQNELTLHMLQEFKIMFKTFEELHCNKQNIRPPNPIRTNAEKTIRNSV
tara:strand:+ start:670 stop:1311 length:642 start_codon:yes stop_codon:yes gene_type:complete